MLNEHRNKVSDIAFSPNGKQVATTSHDGLVRLWDVETGELVTSFSGHEGGANRLAFDSTGKRLATAVGFDIDRIKLNSLSSIPLSPTHAYAPARASLRRPTVACGPSAAT